MSISPPFGQLFARRILICFLFSVAGAYAQDVTSVTTTVGQVYASSSLRRSGNTLFIKIPAAQGSGVIEIGLPISQIANVDFHKSSDFSSAVAAAKAGDAATVISRTETNITTEADFKDIPGSFWPVIARLRLLALASAGRNADAAALAGSIGVINDPMAASLSRGGTLFSSLDSSDMEAVIVGANAIPRLSGEPGAALAQLALGRALLEKKDYPGALRAFLTIKVFYPSLTLLQPAALMGAAKAYIGLDDQKRALQSVVEIQESYPRSLQVPEAKKIEKNLSKS